MNSDSKDEICDQLAKSNLNDEPASSSEASAAPISNKREAFGNRFLTNDQNVFEFNAW
jgi:hypothetical protein